MVYPQPRTHTWISAFEDWWAHEAFMDEDHFVGHLRFHNVSMYDPHAQPRT